MCFTGFQLHNEMDGNQLHRWEIINYIAERYDLRRYLEIGVQANSQNFDKIKIEDKTGVDPKRGGTHRMTSDQFFEEHRGEPFDLVFIDGLHQEDQVDKDFNNSLSCLAFYGWIVLHDALPDDAFTARPICGRDGRWHGTVWRSVVKIIYQRLDLLVFVTVHDEGITLVTRGKREEDLPAFSLAQALDVDFFFDHKLEIMRPKLLTDCQLPFKRFQPMRIL